MIKKWIREYRDIVAIPEIQRIDAHYIRLEELDKLIEGF